jgi:ribosome biogenesis protein ERB1
MPLKRKPVTEEVVASANDDEDEDSGFELGLLSDELSSDEDLDDSGDEAGSESGENLEDEPEADGTEDLHTNDETNGETNRLDGSESENLLSDDSSEFYSSDDEVVIDADGNLRKLLPEIDPHYDSDSSTLSEINTIGNIDMEKYYPASMPHIGYDINGRRIMRPAAGAALDQLLDTIDLPKGWTGIIDKETGELKNLTDEELEIIKRIRREELPNDQIEIYDVPPTRINYLTKAVSFSKRRSISIISRTRA